MRHITGTMLLVLALAVGLASPPPAHAEQGSVELVRDAKDTLESMLKDPNIGSPLRSYLIKAKGVFIMPLQIKAAFFFGAQGGNGVLLARDRNGVWGYPAFYTLAGGSVGLQFGVEGSEAVLAILTEHGLNAIVDNKFKIGGEVSAAAGPAGQGNQGDTTTALGGDVVTYLRNKGLFLGASLTGAGLAPRDDYDHGFYGPNADSQGILYTGKFANPVADPLRATLQAIR